MYLCYSFIDTTPSFIVINPFSISIVPEQNILISNSQYKLIGLIYYGSFHFTCRVIDYNNNVWFNDGIATGRTMKNERSLHNFTLTQFNKTRGKALCSLVYMKVT